MNIIVSIIISLITNYFTSYTYDMWRNKTPVQSDYVPIVLVTSYEKNRATKRQRTSQIDHRAINRAKLGIKLTQIILFMFTSILWGIALYVPVSFLQGIGHVEFDLSKARLTAWIFNSTVPKSTIYWVLVFIGIISFIPITRLSDFFVKKAIKLIDNYEVVTFDTWVKVRATIFGIVSFVVFGLGFFLWSEMSFGQSFFYALVLLALAFVPMAENNRK